MWRRRQQNDRTRRRLLHTAHVPVCFLECVAWRGAGVSPSAGPHLAQTLAAAAGSRQASLESLECPSISPPSRCSCTLLPHQPPPPPDSKRVERVKRDKRDKSEEKANREQEAHTHTQHTQHMPHTAITQQSERSEDFFGMRGLARHRRVHQPGRFVCYSCRPDHVNQPRRQ